MNSTRKKEMAILVECLEKQNQTAIVKEYGNLIYATIRKTIMFAGLSLNKEDLEDIQIEVFIRLFENDCRKLRLYNPDKLSLAGWVKLIANQTTIDEIRKKDPHALAKQREKVLFDDFYLGISDDYEHHYQVKEELKVVEEAISEMHPNDQSVLKMFYYQHFSLKEVAGMMGKSLKATQAAKDRARKRLKENVYARM